MGENQHGGVIRWDPVVVRHRVDRPDASPFISVRVALDWLLAGEAWPDLDEERTVHNVANHTLERTLRDFPDCAFRLVVVRSGAAFEPEIAIARVPPEEFPDGIADTVYQALKLARYEVFARGRGLVFRKKPAGLRWRSDM